MDLHLIYIELLSVVIYPTVFQQINLDDIVSVCCYKTGLFVCNLTCIVALYGSNRFLTRSLIADLLNRLII